MISRSRFTPPLVSLWEGRRHQSIDGSLVFADISGFTALSERLAALGRVGAEELTAVLDRVFGGMLEAAQRRGGLLASFGGDALLLAFTGPGHAVAAADAAITMRRLLRESGRIPTSVGRVPLRMSVGLHTGRLDLIAAGDSHRELILAGPAVTAVLGAETIATAGEIRLTDGAVAALPLGAAAAGSSPRLLRRRRPFSDQPADPNRPTGTSATRALPGPAIGFLSGPLQGWVADGDPEPEHRIAAVGFIRAAGLDAALAADPAAAAAGIDATLSAVQSIAADHEVTFLATDAAPDGFKAILVAGVPAAGDDDVGQLLRACLAITRLPAGDLRLSAGVHRGHVFAGAVGTESAAVLTVMGDTVNTAARLMAAAEPGTVVASADALAAAAITFATGDRQELVLKGKTGTLAAFALISESGRREQSGATGPFVGRDGQLADISGRLAAAGAGNGATVLVTGPPGIGKTRLLDEARHRHDGPRLRIRAEPYGSANPYRPFRDPFRRLLSLTSTAESEVPGALRRYVAAVAPDLLPWLPLLADVAQTTVPPTAEVDALEARFRPDRLADVLIALVDAATGGEVLLLAVDDAHWMDLASARLLGRLATAAKSRPWLLLVARRDDDGGFLPDSPYRLQLPPLSDADAEELVDRLTTGAPLLPGDRTAVVTRSGGNPLFLRELVRGRSTLDADQLPDSLDALLARQLDDLPPLPRRVVRVASVLGRSFRAEVLRRVLADETLPQAWQTGLADLLMDDGPDRLRFRHAVLRDAAYGTLSYRRRRDLHRRAAEVMLAVDADHLEQVADVLALHFDRAGDAAQSWRFSQVAAGRARQAYAMEDAAEQYRRALRAARRITVPDADVADVLISLGDVSEQAGRFDEALAAYRRATALTPKPLRPRLHLRRARARERGGAYSAALRELATAQRLLPQTADGDRLRAEILAFRASVLAAQNRYRRAARQAADAVALARSADAPAALARALDVLEDALQRTGRPAGGRYAAEALRLYEELGDLSAQARVTNNLGVVAYFDGRWDDALQWYRLSGELGRRAGDTLNSTGLNIAEVLLNRGRPDLAIPLLREAARVLRAAGFVDGATFAETHLGRALFATGSTDEAESLLRAAYAELLDQDQPVDALETAIHLAGVLGGTARGAEGVELLAEAADRAGAEAAHFALDLAIARAICLRDAGLPADAQRELSTALAASPEADYPRAIATLVAADLGVADTVAVQQAQDLLARLGVGQILLPGQREVLGSPVP